MARGMIDTTSVMFGMRTALCGILPGFVATIVLTPVTASAFQDAAIDVTDNAARSLVEQAEALLSQETSELRRSIDSAASIPSSAESASALRRLSGLMRESNDLDGARDAAVRIDTKDDASRKERALSLVTLALAEHAATEDGKAWWTLHEAQKTALKLKSESALIEVMREISAAEKAMIGKRSAARSDVTAGDVQTVQPAAESVSPDNELDPKPDDVLKKVLKDGLPERGYNEIEVLSTGGGPLREEVQILHGYYYNGDRWFQGPSLPGGQTKIMLRHPRTGTKCYVMVNLPSGAPIVEYYEHAIEYHYPDIVVKLKMRKDGMIEIDYRKLFNKYAKRTKEIEKRRIQALEQIAGNDPTGGGFQNVLSIGLGGPLNLARRLPLISGLFDDKDKRVPGTLTAPTGQ